MERSEMSALEILECARINFDNVAKMNPGLKVHPIYQMAIEQLEDGIKKVAAFNDSPCGVGDDQ